MFKKRMVHENKQLGFGWNLNRLFELADKAKVFLYPVWDIDVSPTLDKWNTVTNDDAFMYHLDLIVKADLRYPIIFNKDTGELVDGFHRSIKARSLGKRLIKAVSIVMPEPDYCLIRKRPNNEMKGIDHGRKTDRAAA